MVEGITKVQIPEPVEDILHSNHNALNLGYFCDLSQNTMLEVSLISILKLNTNIHSRGHGNFLRVKKHYAISYWFINIMVSSLRRQTQAI